MRFDPSAQERFDEMDTRKANRTQVVQKLPPQAEAGDTAYMDGELYLYERGKWHDVAQKARDEFTAELVALAGRVKTLEDD